MSLNQQIFRHVRIWANFEITVKEAISLYTLNDGTYDLTAMTRRKVVGRNKQLDKGTGRYSWKCHDPLNCEALVAFWKVGTCVQIWHMGANMDQHFLEKVLASWTLDFGHIWDHRYINIFSNLHGYYLLIFDMLRKLKRENVTCRSGFGISIGLLERIGELGYIAITPDSTKAYLEESFLEKLIYFSCELIICFTVSWTWMVWILQASSAQKSSKDWSYPRRQLACFILR